MYARVWLCETICGAIPIAFSSLTFVFILDLGMVVIFTTYIYVTALITVISDVILDKLDTKQFHLVCTFTI